MSTLLKSAALVLCAGVSCAQAAETAKQWEFNIGAMYEIENVEGQGDDKDGLYEPSVWFNATWDAWTISLAMYQEGPVDYSSMTRGTYFDRPEFELRYRFIGTDDFTFGLTGGFRNYGYHFKDEHGARDGSANMQRYKVQPDWDIKLTDDWRFSGKRAARTVLTGMCYSVGSATRQGSSSLTRFIGQSAITSSTWRR